MNDDKNDEWEYKYCEHEGLEFWICYDEDDLMFDVDYKGNGIVWDFGKGDLEVVV